MECVSVLKTSTKSVRTYRSSQRIDEIIGATLPEFAPAFWLASKDYDAPKKHDGPKEGMTPPIPVDFASPWIGRPMKDLVEWLKAKPEDDNLNDRHFAVLDTGARDDPPTLVVCRFGNLRGEGDDVYTLRKGPSTAVDHLVGCPSDGWDEYVRYHGNAEIRYDQRES